MRWSWNQLASLTIGISLAIAAPALYAAPSATSGSIVGTVSSGTGAIGQMGATVALYNRFEKMVQRTLTNSSGNFGFDGLIPDSYSIRVTLPSFVPAIRNNIAVQPGMRSFLAINLASVLSSIEVLYTMPGPASLMSDEWKWVLRSSMSTRPVLRFLPEQRSAIFSQTRGTLKVTAGDAFNSMGTAQPDLGTAFAVATSILGNNQLQVSGNLGYTSRMGLPTASFRTRYSRLADDYDPLPIGSSPEVQLTVRQTLLPGHMLNRENVPMLRTMSTTVMDHARFSDSVDVLYGAQLESVTYFDRLNIFSPFARMTYRLPGDDSLQVAFSSGSAPEELYLTNSTAAEREVGNDLSTLSAFPRISLRANRTHVQRIENVEAAYHKRMGRTSLTAAGYLENVSNAALPVMGDTNLFLSNEMLPDIFSNSSIFNIGSYQRHGMMVMGTYNFTDKLSVSAGAGNSGTLEAGGERLRTENPEELRNALHPTQNTWGYVRGTATIPKVGTRFVASYLISNYSAALPAHRYLTSKLSPDLGLNIQVRQPLPSLGLWAGRLEAIAELRNLLSQGYLPIETADGRRLVLIPSPKSVRGGLSFIF